MGPPHPINPELPVRNNYKIVILANELARVKSEIPKWRLWSCNRIGKKISVLDLIKMD
jgi:hypothetical protein